MAEALYLVTRTDQGVNHDKNRVREVIINNDDGDADAVIITNTIAALNAAQPVEAGSEAVYPPLYFDTVNQISDLVTAGDLRTDQDFIAFAPRVASVTT
jgi:hypothetical protein